MVCEWCRSFTPKDRQEKNLAWTFRYGMRMVQIIYPKGQTRKEPSLDIQVWYANGADHLPQRTDKKRTYSLEIQVWYANGADHLPQRTDKK